MQITMKRIQDIFIPENYSDGRFIYQLNSTIWVLHITMQGKGEFESSFYSLVFFTIHLPFCQALALKGQKTNKQ